MYDILLPQLKDDCPSTYRTYRTYRTCQILRRYLVATT